MRIDDDGIRFAPARSDHQTVADATGRSGTRRGLFEEGAYTPRDYRIVMRREQTIRWHETTTALLG